MKKVLIALFLSTQIVQAQVNVPFYGNRKFISASRADTLEINWDVGGITLLKSTRPISIPSLVQQTPLQVNSDWNATSGLAQILNKPRVTVATGKTLTSNNTITLSGTDGSTLNIGSGGTLGTAAYTATTAYEARLGNPSTNGYVLSSTTTGTRSWVAVQKVDAYAALTDAATITWDCSTGLNKTITISSSRTLSITNATSGMEGDLVITVSGGTPTITLPAGGLLKGSVSGLAVGTYHLCWRMVGTVFHFNIGNYTAY